MTEVPVLPYVVGGLDVATDRIELEVMGWSDDKSAAVTRHDEESDGPLSDAERKRRQREREEADGVGETRVKMGPGDKANLEKCRVGRGSQGIPYTATEYINTLVRRDAELLDAQLKKLNGRICENCRKPLPRGCGGVWRDEDSCLMARAERALEL